MLSDYEDLLTAQPNEEQTRDMLKVMNLTVLAALKVLPRTPETETAWQVLDKGAALALYQKVRHVMTPEEYWEEIARIMQEEIDRRNTKSPAPACE